MITLEYFILALNIRIEFWSRGLTLYILVIEVCACYGFIKIEFFSNMKQIFFAYT